MRHKYVEEHFRRWMEFGVHLNYTPRRVDVTDSNGDDVVTAVTSEVAEKLIKAREDFVDQLCQIFDEHPDQFHVYGPPIKMKPEYCCSGGKWPPQPNDFAFLPIHGQVVYRTRTPPYTSIDFTYYRTLEDYKAQNQRWRPCTP